MLQLQSETRALKENKNEGFNNDWKVEKINLGILVQGFFKSEKPDFFPPLIWILKHQDRNLFASSTYFNKTTLTIYSL